MPDVIPTLRYYGFNDQGVLNAESDTGQIISPRADTERMRVDWYMLFSHAPNGVRDNLDLPDGASGSFTSIFRPTDDGNYTWQKINRVLDGRLLPNINEIVVQRK